MSLGKLELKWTKWWLLTSGIINGLEIIKEKCVLNMNRYDVLFCFSSGSIVVSSGCYHKHTTDWFLSNNIYFSPFWSLGSARPRCLTISCLLRACSWFADGCRLAVSSQRDSEQVLWLFLWGSHPSHGSPPQDVSTSQRLHLLLPSHWG